MPDAFAGVSRDTQHAIGCNAGVGIIRLPDESVKIFSAVVPYLIALKVSGSYRALGFQS